MSTSARWGRCNGGDWNEPFLGTACDPVRQGTGSENDLFHHQFYSRFDFLDVAIHGLFLFYGKHLQLTVWEDDSDGTRRSVDAGRGSPGGGGGRETTET